MEIKVGHVSSPPLNSSNEISSSSSNTNTGNGDGCDEVGKQIVELISRLINEVDPETEKINVEFIITPFQMNKVAAAETEVSTSSASVIKIDIAIKSQSSQVSSAPSSKHFGHRRRRRQSSRASISSSNNNNEDDTLASISPYKSTAINLTPKKSDSEKLDELSYAYYQSLVQQQRFQRNYLEEMPSKPSSKESKNLMKKKKRRSTKKKNKKHSKTSTTFAASTDSALSEVKMDSENKMIKSSKKSSTSKKHRRRHRKNHRRDGSPDGKRSKFLILIKHFWG
uniref:Uncharacterized protein n=1 Tax=Panagrolaimus davidi TaxID=227884 RepID=A0A914Q2J6_9BILA